MKYQSGDIIERLLDIEWRPVQIVRHDCDILEKLPWPGMYRCRRGDAIIETFSQEPPLLWSCVSFYQEGICEALQEYIDDEKIRQAFSELPGDDGEKELDAWLNSETMKEMPEIFRVIVFDVLQETLGVKP